MGNHTLKPEVTVCGSPGCFDVCSSISLREWGATTRRTRRIRSAEWTIRCLKWPEKPHLYMQVYCTLQSFGNSKDFIPLFTILLMTWFSMLEKEKILLHYNVCFLELPIHLLPTIPNKSDPFWRKVLKRSSLGGRIHMSTNSRTLIVSGMNNPLEINENLLVDILNEKYLSHLLEVSWARILEITWDYLYLKLLKNSWEYIWEYLRVLENAWENLRVLKGTWKYLNISEITWE